MSDDYALVPAVTVERAPLVDFVAAIWPDLVPEERIRAFWWMRAAPEFAVAAVHRTSGAMAGLCGGRHGVWNIAHDLQLASHPAVAICDWYIAPGHAGKGLGKRLVGHFDQPERFLYAFSISDAAIANFQKLGWVGPFRSSLMLLLIPPRLARHLARLRSRRGITIDRYERARAEPLGALAAALDRIEAQRDLALPAHMRRDAAEWSWRLSVCGERNYRLSVASRDGEPAGYVAVRPMTPGRSRSLDRLRAAMITDLATSDDDPALLTALAGEAVAIAADLGARAVVTATTTAAHRAALARMGFIAPTVPLLGRLVAGRSPQFMWLPRGPAAAFTADDLSLSFADVALDLDL